MKPEDVVDPSSYFFHRAVCEHALMLQEQADASIDRLLVDVQDAPERYRMVAALMRFDMMTWADKDLGWIARKMGNIQRRLDLKRGGKQTQKIQKEVLVRLDELIKEKENKAKSQGAANGGSCPGGAPGSGSGSGSGNQNTPNSPQNDSNNGNMAGTGDVDRKRVREIAEVWGKLPEKERARAMQELPAAFLLVTGRHRGIHPPRPGPYLGPLMCRQAFWKHTWTAGADAVPAVGRVSEPMRFSPELVDFVPVPQGVLHDEDVSLRGAGHRVRDGGQHRHRGGRGRQVRPDGRQRTGRSVPPAERERQEGWPEELPVLRARGAPVAMVFARRPASS